MIENILCGSSKKIKKICGELKRYHRKNETVQRNK